jgi:Uma2 family endonuclease
MKGDGGVEVAWYGFDRMFDPVALRPDRPRRLRRTEYMRLVDAGVFEGEQVELLYGQLVTVIEMQGLDAPARDALLVVEVAHSSQEKDRILKAPLYAQAGIRNYWLVDVDRRKVEVYTQPSGRRYRKVQVLTRRETLRATGLPRISIPVSRILPPPE